MTPDMREKADTEEPTWFGGLGVVGMLSSIPNLEGMTMMANKNIKALFIEVAGSTIVKRRVRPPYKGRSAARESMVGTKETGRRQ